MAGQEDPVQREIHQDWANREYIELITSSIKKIADFLNSFGQRANRNKAGEGEAGAGTRWALNALSCAALRFRLSSTFSLCYDLARETGRAVASSQWHRSPAILQSSHSSQAAPSSPRVPFLLSGPPASFVSSCAVPVSSAECPRGCVAPLTAPHLSPDEMETLSHRALFPR